MDPELLFRTFFLMSGVVSWIIILAYAIYNSTWSKPHNMKGEILERWQQPLVKRTLESGEFIATQELLNKYHAAIQLETGHIVIVEIDKSEYNKNQTRINLRVQTNRLTGQVILVD